MQWADFTWILFRGKKLVNSNGLPEISQQPEGHLDFYLDELALPVPELAALTHYMISEAGGKNTTKWNANNENIFKKV